jgi:hypothetical protein
VYCEIETSAKGCSASYCPLVHSEIGVHCASEVAEQLEETKVLCGQIEHFSQTRSATWLGAASSYSLALQVRSCLHCRSVVNVGPTSSNSVRSLHSVSCWHTASEVAVAGAARYSSPVHAVTGAQRRSEVRVGALTSNSLSSHCARGSQADGPVLSPGVRSNVF